MSSDELNELSGDSDAEYPSQHALGDNSGISGTAYSALESQHQGVESEELISDVDSDDGEKTGGNHEEFEETGHENERNEQNDTNVASGDELHDSDEFEDSDLEIIEVETETGAGIGYNRQESVIELDSEEEIDNLESDENGDESRNFGEELAEGPEETEPTLEASREEADAEIEDIADGIAGENETFLSHEEDSENLENDTDVAHKFNDRYEESIPIIIEILGKRFLLEEVEGTGRFDTSDMVSLFASGTNFDTIHQFLSLLSANESTATTLAEVPGEIVMHIPDLHVRIGQDHQDAKDFTLDQLLELYHGLLLNTKGSVPDYMLFVVTKERRFSDQYLLMQDLEKEGKGLEHIQAALGVVENGGEESGEPGRKRRHVDTGL